MEQGLLHAGSLHPRLTSEGEQDQISPQVSKHAEVTEKSTLWRRRCLALALLGTTAAVVCAEVLPAEYRNLRPASSEWHHLPKDHLPKDRNLHLAMASVTDRIEFDGKAQQNLACGSVEDDWDFVTKLPALYTVSHIKSAEECSQRCVVDRRCALWSWGKVRGTPFLSDVCFLKQLQTKEVPLKVKKTGVVSGVRVETNIEYSTGHPAIHSAPNVKTAIACSQMCSSEPLCAFWSWGQSPAESSQKHVCVLRGTNSGGEVVKREVQGMVSGGRSCIETTGAPTPVTNVADATAANAEHPGDDDYDPRLWHNRFVCGLVDVDMDYWTSLPTLSTVHQINSAEACRTKCNDDKLCTLWVWGKARNKPFLSDVCWLKQLKLNEVPIRVAKSGVISGGRFDVDMDYQTKQGPLKKLTNVLTAEECSSHCSSHPQCRVWSWHPSGAGFLADVCFLKQTLPDEYPKRARMPGVISGGLPCSIFSQERDPLGDPLGELRGALGGELASDLDGAAQGSGSTPSAPLVPSQGGAQVQKPQGAVPFVQIKADVLYWTRRPAIDMLPNILSAETCSKACIDEPPCMVWSFGRDSNICFLQELEPGERPSFRLKSGYVSGELPAALAGRRPAEVAVGHGGQVISCGVVQPNVMYLTRRPATEVLPEIGSADACSQLCIARPPCAVWTLGAERATCFLQELEPGELPSRQRRKGFTSGSRACSLHEASAVESVESMLLAGTVQAGSDDVKCGLIEDDMVYLTRLPAIRMEKQVASAQACVELCFSEPLCRTWTFGKKTAMCALQKLEVGEKPTRSDQAAFMSGTRPCRSGDDKESVEREHHSETVKCGLVEKGAFYLTPQPAIEVVQHVKSGVACSSRCYHKERCAEWAWSDTQGTCFLQELRPGEKPTRREKHEFTSGTRPCHLRRRGNWRHRASAGSNPETQPASAGDALGAGVSGALKCGIWAQDSIYLTARPALDMVPHTHSAQECAKLCFGEGSCGSWTWGQENDMCFLQELQAGEQPSVKHRERHVSGSRPCSSEAQAPAPAAAGGAGGARDFADDEWDSAEDAEDAEDSEDGEDTQDTQDAEEELDEPSDQDSDLAEGAYNESCDFLEEDVDYWTQEPAVDKVPGVRTAARCARHCGDDSRCTVWALDQRRSSCYLLQLDLEERPTRRKHRGFVSGNLPCHAGQARDGGRDGGRDSGREDGPDDGRDQPVRDSEANAAADEAEETDEADQTGSEEQADKDGTDIQCGVIDNNVGYWAKHAPYGQLPHTPTVDACLKLCIADTRCSVWSWYKVKKICYLQELLLDERVSRRVRRGYVSGSLPCQLNATVWQPSATAPSLGEAGQTSPRETPAGTQLNTSHPPVPTVSLAGRPGGVPCDLIAPNTVLSASKPAIASVLGVPSPEACRDQCFEDPHCMAWTLETDTTICYLHALEQDEQPHTRQLPGYFSGGQVCKQEDVRPAGSLFCFALIRPDNQHRDLSLLQLQHNRSAGLFACDEFAIYSSTSITVAPGIVTQSVGSSLDCTYSTDTTSAECFLSILQQVATAERFLYHNWTVMVELDTVFFPDRLRAVLPHHSEATKGVYLNNCQHGPQAGMEVFSRNAVRTFKSGFQTCQQHFAELCLGPCRWIQEMYIDRCFGSVLGIRRDNDWSLLSLESCRNGLNQQVILSPQGCRNGSIAFHPLDTNENYAECMDVATKGATDVALK